MARKKSYHLKNRNLIFSMALMAFILLFDHLAKFGAIAYLKGNAPLVYLNGFVQLEYAENRGAFLSLGAGLSEEARSAIFIIGVFFMLVYCAYTYWKSMEQTFTMLALALVMSGGVGNLIDRIFRGYVVDFVHMGFPSLRTGVFNIADVAISAGVILLLILMGPAKKEA
jgi:signal peptidase II